MSLEAQIKELARTIAADQIAQDIQNNATFAKKGEITGGGMEAAQCVEQLIGFYNGYMGTELDYRDYLDQSASDVLNAFYALGRGYTGVTA